MVMDGLPAGATQLERYQWQSLHMTNALAAKLASRITQLFGRINRGTRDYSAHLVVGRPLNTWLSTDRNLALLSPLLRSQIQLGHALHEQLGIRDHASVLALVDQVLNRDEQWLEIYRSEIQDKDLDPTERERSEQIEEKMIAAANAEVQFATHCWQGQINEGRRILEDVVANVARGDGRIAGWFNLWIGYCFDMAEDHASAQLAYQIARQKLGSNLVLPTGSTTGPGYELDTVFQSKMRAILLASPESYARQERLFLQAVAPLSSGGGSSNALEEAVRQLGEFMGYDSSRPDNEGQGGPDVLWVDRSSRTLVGFELKTDKKAASSYTIEEVGKGHSYLEWLKANYADEDRLGLVFVGPRAPATGRATPSAEMYVVELPEIASISNAFAGFLKEARGLRQARGSSSSSARKMRNLVCPAYSNG
jgi:hypothetical protein